MTVASHFFPDGGRKRPLVVAAFRDYSLIQSPSRIKRGSHHVPVISILDQWKYCTALLLDFPVPPGQGADAIDSFGFKISVTSAHARLDQQTGVPIVPALRTAARWMLPAHLPSEDRVHR